ncbi:MAG: PAS domain S-box protein [Pseudanabaenaceae cyanobacterium bins.39]|nr:PAS domain S-box protein [Pseudanabaenaceae cyanobacterium bins.39]
MGMHPTLNLIATSIRQLQELELIAKSSVSSNTISSQEHLLDDTLCLLVNGLTELEEYQHQLIDDLEKYQELFDFAPDGYFVTDAQGNISEANRAATLLLGSHPIGKNLENFVYPTYKEQFQSLIGQLQRGQNIKSLDFRMQFPTGQPFDASFTIISIRSSQDGHVMGMRWWIQDISQRKQESDKLQSSHQRLEVRIAEMNAKLNLMDRQIRVEREEQRRISRNLTRNEAKLRAIMQYSSDIVNILDIDTTIQYCSPAIFRILGYMPEDVIGKKLIQFIHLEDLPNFQNFVTQSVDTLVVSTPIVMRYKHIKGDWIYLESVCCNLLQDNNVQGLVINSRDITERMRTESALKESESRLTTIASSMPATVYRLSLDTESQENKITIPFISDGLVELVGILPRQVIANPHQIIDLIHPEDVEQFKALIKAGFEKQATFRHEFRIVTISGEVKWVQNITRYYQQVDTPFIFADGVCIDISERGEAEANLQRTNELLRAVIKAVPVAIDIISPEGKVLLWNTTAEKLFGWHSNQNAMTAKQSLPHFHESQALDLQATILDTLAGKPLDSTLISLQVASGEWINASISTVLVHDLNGNIIGVLRIVDQVDRQPNLVRINSQPQISPSSEAIAILPSISAQQVLRQYNLGQRNFAGWNLHGAYLAEMDLSQTDLRGAELNGSDCHHINLQYADLRGADLRGANLQYADLRGADLRGADLRGADLQSAITDQANMLGAILSDDHL